MNTKYFGLILGLAMSFFLVGCAGTKVSAKRPVSVHPNGICASAQTEQDRIICLRAQEIDAQKDAEAARKELLKLATPAEKQATREVQRAQKNNDRFVKIQGMARAQAMIEGCEPGSVWVSPEIAVTSLVGGFLGGMLTAPFNSVRFFNPRSNGESTAIEATDLGPVVKNLCVGGRVTVARQFRYGIDAQYVNYSYKIIGEQSGGSQTTPQYSLYIDTGGNGYTTPNHSYDFDINIRK
jgi:hypothetical protein